MSTEYAKKIELISSVLAPPFKADSGKRFIRWDFRSREYRGKKRIVIEALWSRAYSHYAKGNVYEAVVGYGDDFEGALENAKLKHAKPVGR